MTLPIDVFELIEPSAPVALRVDQIDDWVRRVGLMDWFRLMCFQEVMDANAINTDELCSHLRTVTRDIEAHVPSNWHNNQIAFDKSNGYDEWHGWRSYGDNNHRLLVRRGRERQPLTLPQACLLIVALDLCLRNRPNGRSLGSSVQIFPALYCAAGYDPSYFDTHLSSNPKICNLISNQLNLTARGSGIASMKKLSEGQRMTFANVMRLKSQLMASDLPDCGDVVLVEPTYDVDKMLRKKGKQPLSVRYNAGEYYPMARNEHMPVKKERLTCPEVLELA